MTNRKRVRPGVNIDSFGASTNKSSVTKIKSILKQIDLEVQKFVHDIVNDSSDDVSDLYFKTEFLGMLYGISLFSTQTKATARKEWPVVDFLELGRSGKLELEINAAVKKLLLTVRDPKNKTEEHSEEIIQVN